MFLRERDRAQARGDWGVVRSLTADLQRLGVPDDATRLHPAGKPSRVVTEALESPQEGEVAVLEEEPRPKGGRPKLPRCEHGNITDRCVECNPELEAH